VYKQAQQHPPIQVSTYHISKSLPKFWDQGCQYGVLGFFFWASKKKKKTKTNHRLL
jgi:hypothetical protein